MMSLPCDGRPPAHPPAAGRAERQCTRKPHRRPRSGTIPPGLAPSFSEGPFMLRSAPWLLAAALLIAGLAPAADTKTDEAKLSKDEQRIRDLTNEARAKEKLPPLKVNATLVKVARAHSANMAKQGKMEHVLDDKNPAQRIEKAGYDYRSVGENIAWG